MNKSLLNFTFRFGLFHKTKSIEWSISTLVIGTWNASSLTFFITDIQISESETQLGSPYRRRRPDEAQFLTRNAPSPLIHACRPLHRLTLWSYSPKLHIHFIGIYVQYLDQVQYADHSLILAVLQKYIMLYFFPKTIQYRFFSILD